MKTCLDCLPCLTRNAVVIARKCCCTPAVQERIVTASMQMLAKGDRRMPPPFFAGKIMDLALKATGDPDADPYRTEKEKSTALAKQLLSELKNIPEYDPSSFESRLRLAVAGNILDFGVFADLDLKEAVKTIRQAFTAPVDLEAVRKLEARIKKSRRILYVLDNCGEAVFDRKFMELFEDKVTVAVRGRNSLNDVTRGELAASGYGESFPIVDSRSNIPGVVPEFIGPELRQAMESADLIIAKGQGNFETMDEIPYPVSFLFLAKCPVVIRKIGAEMKSIQIRNVNF